MEILIFKTNVRKRTEVSKVRSLLISVPSILNWNFDLDDCDNILRIESNGLNTHYIESLLQNAGFDCRELDD